MSDKKPVQRIVIAGGGTAGWMMASAIARTMGQTVDLTLVESEMIGTVGVGEATIPPIKTLNQTMGLNEVEFVRRTQGTFKLGIQFNDWAKVGHSYFHQFGPHGVQFDYSPLHQYWLKSRQFRAMPTIDEYSMAWAAAPGRLSSSSTG